jgi:hypothetical protein
MSITPKRPAYAPDSNEEIDPDPIPGEVAEDDTEEAIEDLVDNIEEEG